MMTKQEFMSHMDIDETGEYCFGEPAWASGDFVEVLSFGVLDEYGRDYSADDCEEAMQMLLKLWREVTGADIEYDLRYNAVFLGNGSEDTIDAFIEDGGCDVLRDIEQYGDWRGFLNSVL